MASSIDYRSPSTPVPAGRRHVTRAAAVAAGAVVAVNAFLLLAAYADRSWGALAIGMMIGPIANGVTAVVGLACVRGVKRRAEGAPLNRYLFASLLLPLLAVPADFFAIGAMDLHGC